MIIGHRWWILIWYGILTIGVVGLLASIYWARQTHWRNLDEILRAIGTVTVSLGMLLFLYDVAGGAAETLLLAALLAFVLAFVVGRRPDTRDRPPPPGDEADPPQ
ncbi:MAG: hypothetical protein SFV24_14215 [Gemmatimonadales bacterium]|nr:hypothetical protein [Gemmatimonadota bacterium]MDX2058957.1 hypothetical protein [Gemmatimonadales bacterium]